MPSRLISGPAEAELSGGFGGWEHIAFSGDFLWDRAAQATSRKLVNLSPKRQAA